MSTAPIAATLFSLLGLAACVPPPAPPPPRYRQDPNLAPQPVDPYGRNYDVSPAPPSDPTQPQPAPAPEATGTGAYPAATRTANPNQVLSPYEPYNLIDVEGFQSGQLARDPSNQKIFRIP
jgi:hypothetical protein